MKNLLLCLLCQFCLCPLCTSQLQCIQCFEKNDPISPGANNLVSNGGFENTSCAPGWLSGSYCPNSSSYNCDLDSWACTDGDVQSYPSVFDSTLSLVPEGQFAAYFGNGNAFTCSDFWNDFSCLSFTACAVSGFRPGYPKSLPGYGEQKGVSLEQVVSGLTVGHTYVLEFWAGGEPLEGLLSANGIFAVDIGFGKTFLTCKPTDYENYPVGTVYLMTFKATATDHTIKFTNWGHVCAECTELVIDNVRLYTFEELSNEVPPCLTSTDGPSVKSKVEVFPSPFNSTLTVVTDLQQNVQFSLFNNLSQPVLQTDVLRNATMNTDRLPEGVYFYEIRNKNEVIQAGKLVKE